MKDYVSVTNAIGLSIDAMRRCDDYNDTKIVSTFMIVLDSIINSPSEIISLRNPLKLSIVLTTLITSDFTIRYPRYYNYNTGKIACAVGFYCFMKELETNVSALNLPTIIVLLHDGRHFMAELFEEYMNSRVRSPYNPLDVFCTMEASSKKYAIVKGLEYLMHKTYNEYNLYDENLSEWKYDLSLEIKQIEKVAETNDFFDYAKKLYGYLDTKFKSNQPFVFDE